MDKLAVVKHTPCLDLIGTTTSTVIRTLLADIDLTRPLSRSSQISSNTELFQEL
jgi:hypothetical protein